MVKGLENFSFVDIPYEEKEIYSIFQKYVKRKQRRELGKGERKDTQFKSFNLNGVK